MSTPYENFLLWTKSKKGHAADARAEAPSKDALQNKGGQDSMDPRTGQTRPAAAE
jgi:hypothetical protein